MSDMSVSNSIMQNSIHFQPNRPRLHTIPVSLWREGWHFSHT